MDITMLLELALTGLMLNLIPGNDMKPEAVPDGELKQELQIITLYTNGRKGLRKWYCLVWELKWR